MVTKNSALPLETNPASWTITGRSAHCNSAVPLTDKYNAYNTCYQGGTDLNTCGTSTGYRDAFNQYQQCLAGTDPSCSSTAPMQNVVNQALQTGSCVSVDDSGTTGATAATQSSSQDSTSNAIDITSLVLLCVNTAILGVVLYVIYKRKAAGIV
jgi:hypothetical protein